MKITKKKFQYEGLPYDLFLTARQKSNIRKAFASNMSIYIKLSQSWLVKIIQLGRFPAKKNM